MDINDFSDEMLAGQRIMAGFEGTELNRDLAFVIGELKVCGIILFSINIKSPEQLKTLCSEAQTYAKSCGLPPLFIAVDQEGGSVARLREPFTVFGPAAHMKGIEDAVRFSEITAEELSSVGINMDMAPVMDVKDRSVQSVMEGRAFGHDPQWVSKLGTTIIDHLQKNGIMAVAKHFPGIGRTTLDSHLHLPVLPASKEELEETDLAPFRAAIRHSTAGIMLSHILYSDLDEKWPASLSVKIARDLLRDRMGYRGVVMTDDLDMKAIKFDMAVIAQRILAAHIDIALICHKGPDRESAFNGILKGITQSSETKRAALESVKRIMSLKREYL